MFPIPQIFDMNHFAKNLLFLFRQTGETQAALALRVEKKPNTISNWVNEVSQPSLDDLIIITNFFDVSADEILNTDLEKGNLMVKKGGILEHQKDNLKDNPSGNPLSKSGKYQSRKNRGEIAINDSENPILLDILKEMRKNTENIEQMRVSMEKIFSKISRE